MKTKIQIKTLMGSVLFEHEQADNTIKDTLQDAVKRGADLQGAYLQGAYLGGADLGGAYLQGAYLQGAYLGGADLGGAYLQGAYLQGAYLRGAYLQGAYLRGADLGGAYLQGADLQGADLQRADLRGADLQRANALNTLLPDGDIIAWKKLQGGLIAKLLVPAKAKRVNCIGSRKCRFQYVQTLAIYNGKKNVKTGIGSHDNKTVYTVGKITKPDKFNDSPLIECSNGIHGFITRLEAEEY